MRVAVTGGVGKLGQWVVRELRDASEGREPHEVTFRTNVMGSFNVHEAAWRLGIRRVASVSSEAVLGWDYREREFAPDYLPIDESHPVRPQDAYGLSKEVGESIARSYTAK